MSASSNRGPWRLLAQQRIYDNPWITVTEHDIVTPGGSPGIYGVVHLKHLAVGIIPVDADGCVHMVGQHRFPRDYYSWELPEGGGKLDTAPVESAVRELREECGLVAHSWHQFLVMDLSNSVTDEQAFSFFAWNLEQHDARPEDTEEIEVRRMPFSAAVEMAYSGEIIDAFSLTMLFKAEVMRRRGELPPGLAELLPQD
jgi:8-oxo-dGTP pyrophosphatase MutT (NUDIX family)